MTIHWKAVEQYFTVVLFIFQCYPVLPRLGTVASENVKYCSVKILVELDLIVLLISCFALSFHK